MSSVSCAPFELPGAKIKIVAATGTITAGAAGTWQESGGQGQAVAQQSGSVSQQAEAQSAAATATGTAAGAKGATAKPEISKRRAAGRIAST